MAVIFYITSMLTSVVSLTLLLMLTFSEEDANIHRFFSGKEVVICVFIAFAMMAAGFILDRR